MKNLKKNKFYLLLFYKRVKKKVIKFNLKVLKIHILIIFIIENCEQSRQYKYYNNRRKNAITE